MDQHPAPLIKKPNSDQAKQFALMLYVGVPPSQAILYFMPAELLGDVELINAQKQLYLDSEQTQKEFERLIGGKWEEMSLEQRIKVSLDKHYAEKAYFLFARNYSELSGAELTKAQEARKVLEAKSAGTSGKLDPLAQLWEDLRTQKVKLAERPLALPA